MDTQTLNKLSEYKKNIENDRVNICKQIKTETVKKKDKYTKLTDTDIIDKIIKTKEYKGTDLEAHNDILKKYTCFICTGKYNIKIGEFDILTDNQLKALKMEQYYKDLKKGSSKLEEIDNTIFKGLTTLYKKDPSQNQVTCMNYDKKTGICSDSNVYSKLNTKVRTKIYTKKKSEQINDNAIYLLMNKKKLIDTLNIYYTLINKENNREGLLLLKKNIKDLIENKKEFDVYKKLMAYIPDKKKDLFLSILFSSDNPGINPEINKDMIITVKMLLKNTNDAKISLKGDSIEKRKKMIGELLKEPFTNYNEFTEGYVNYIKEYGFRK